MDAMEMSTGLVMLITVCCASVVATGILLIATLVLTLSARSLMLRLLVAGSPMALKALRDQGWQTEEHDYDLGGQIFILAKRVLHMHMMRRRVLWMSGGVIPICMLSWVIFLVVR